MNFKENLSIGAGFLRKALTSTRPTKPPIKEKLLSKSEIDAIIAKRMSKMKKKPCESFNPSISPEQARAFKARLINIKVKN